MAKGYPDFFGMPIFPSYGAVNQLDSGAVDIPMGTIVAIINLVGKFRIQGGGITCTCPAGLRLDRIRCTVDGTVYPWIAFQYMQERWGWEDHQMLKVVYDDANNQRLTMVFDPDWSIRDSLYVEYESNGGGNAVAQIMLYYNLII